MRVVAVGAGHVAARLDRVVEQDRHVRADGPDVAGRADPLRELVLPRGPELRPERVLELHVVDAVVAADHDQHEPAVLHHHRVGLQQRARGHLEAAGDLRDRDQAGRVLQLRLGERRRQLHRLRVGARDLDVRGVAGRQRDVVLARRGRRHVLVGADAAHHPDVGLDAVPLEPAAVHHAVVRLAVALVVRVQPLAVAVEGVGVLHDELARAQQAGARARLVALLDLEVVEAERQVAVGAHHLGDVLRDGLLVRHRQHELGAPAVLELEQLGDRVAAAALPQLGRVQHRHQQLLAADRVHLLADDLHHLLVYAPAGRKERPQPGAELADQPRADHQLVRERLGVAGACFSVGRK